MLQDGIVRICEMCPTDISHLSKRAKVCSPKCRNKRTAQKLRQDLQDAKAAEARFCEFCNKDISHMHGLAKTCSPECKQEIKRAYMRDHPRLTNVKRGFAEWQPQAHTRRLLDQVGEILIEYEAHLPMSVRQIFYRLVGAYGYDKDLNAYAVLVKHLASARHPR